MILFDLEQRAGWTKREELKTFANTMGSVFDVLVLMSDALSMPSLDGSHQGGQP